MRTKKHHVFKHGNLCNIKKSLRTIAERLAKLEPSSMEGIARRKLVGIITGVMPIAVLILYVSVVPGKADDNLLCFPPHPPTFSFSLASNSSEDSKLTYLVPTTFMNVAVKSSSGLRIKLD